MAARRSDLETCENVFVGSNAVACLTRHVMAFHRQQFIDMYFQQWDAEKYENLGAISDSSRIRICMLMLFQVILFSTTTDKPWIFSGTCRLTLS